MRISDNEAAELLRWTVGRTADFSGHYNESYRVQTSAGAALLRRSRRDVHQGYDPRLMSEVEALTAAAQTAAQVPAVLFASEGLLIEQFIVGHHPSLDSPEVPIWVENLLSQIKALQTNAIVRPPLHTVFDWQQWLQRFLADLYATLPPIHAARIGELRLPPIEQVWVPDSSQSARDLTLVHSDLHPANLLVNNQGVWILDWELAMLADPVWEAAVALHRTPWPTAELAAEVEGLWLDLIGAASTGELLRQYRAIETWKSLIVDSARFPERVAADPLALDSHADRFHELLIAAARTCGCAEFSLDEVKELLSRWAAAEHA
ncbi:phosphotransferase family enzyme [Nocardia tenerifensis]|uniref:Phosphotransferase family enzyme n=1 Tax=Nocardia tenerifensis TaxID=228006 RepID=A0A318JRS7_9NOCA|nr:aminoglycoside phosphotransferase family protein [Nocardia tenerifensis]PXX52293.1 phosphotransferase family enzyme [Nocardia tenerifensis]